MYSAFCGNKDEYSTFVTANLQRIIGYLKRKTNSHKLQVSDNNKEIHLALEIMLRDYDFIINKVPDFHYAYYNKANILCAQKEFKDAIAYYSKAIEIDEDFAEAYFNRGLTYIYTDEVNKGIDDLSKAGELGIYQAYNLISRFK